MPLHEHEYEYELPLLGRIATCESCAARNLAPLAGAEYGPQASSSQGSARTGPSRSVIPIDPDQRFQVIPITRSD
jgi:hypothetical protein